MSKRTPYDSLILIPSVVAETVAEMTYTGSEMSDRVRDGAQVARIEAARSKMTREQVAEFARLVDARCRTAYAAKADWFQKCVKRSKSNSGRDQLYVWVSHWLASYLTDPAAMRRDAAGYTA